MQLTSIMDFMIREKKTEQDMDYFIAVEFAAAKENGLINQKKSEEEYKKELIEFLDNKRGACNRYRNDEPFKIKWVQRDKSFPAKTVELNNLWELNFSGNSL